MTYGIAGIDMVGVSSGSSADVFEAALGSDTHFHSQPRHSGSGARRLLLSMENLISWASKSASVFEAAFADMVWYMVMEKAEAEHKHLEGDGCEDHADVAEEAEAEDRGTDMRSCAAMVMVAVEEASWTGLVAGSS